MEGLMKTSATDEVEEFKAFLHTERKCIDKDKWLEGERLNCDPGQTYILKWINENGREFRDKWDESQCKYCVSAFNCGHYLRKKCSTFIERKTKTTKRKKQ